MNIILSFLLLTMPLISERQDKAEAQKDHEYGLIVCEDELAYLDNYAILLQAKPDSRGYVIVYGGRRDTRSNQVRDRLRRIRKYLTSNRRVESGRIIGIDGGFREAFTVELWFVPRGAAPPKLNPTVGRREVTYKGKGGEGDCSFFYQ